MFYDVVVLEIRLVVAICCEDGRLPRVKIWTICSFRCCKGFTHHFQLVSAFILN